MKESNEKSSRDALLAMCAIMTGSYLGPIVINEVIKNVGYLKIDLEPFRIADLKYHWKEIAEALLGEDMERRIDIHEGK